MADLTNNFLKGRMNKDLDERLVPNGEYRDALNVEISTSEGSNVGSVQNVKGNTKINTMFPIHPASTLELSSEAITVGSISSESENKIYNFVHLASNLTTEVVSAGINRKVGVKSDAIIEYSSTSAENGFMYPRVVDVFEARHVLPVQTSTTSLTGFTAATGSQPTVVAGVRKGMRVQLILPDGSDVFGNSNDIRVLQVSLAGVADTDPTNVVVTISSNNVLYTQSLIDAGAVYKFTADRILNFNPGIYEIEDNTAGNPLSSTSVNNLITGINYVDGVLFYTDGKNEPKRIVLDKFNALDGSLASWVDIKQHSIFLWKAANGLLSWGDLKEEHITTIRKNPSLAPKVTKIATNRIGGNPIGSTSLNYSSKTMSLIGLNTAGNPGVTMPFNLIEQDTSVSPTEYSVVEPGHSYDILAADKTVNWLPNDTLELTGVFNASSVRAKIVSADTSSTANVGKFTIEIVDIEASYGLDLENNPTDSTLTPLNEQWKAVLIEKETIYEDSFIYFACRYKYVDGEYSAISPFSEPIFIPGFYSYNAQNSFNKGMENRLKQVSLKDFIPHDIGKDVSAVEVLFKKSGSDNVYVIETIDRAGWWGSTTGDENVVINTSIFGRTLPSDQLVRIYDAVPVRAKAQEFTGSRLLYGNYELGYDLKDSSGNFIQPDIESSIHALDVSLSEIIPSSNDALIDWTATGPAYSPSASAPDFAGSWSKVNRSSFTPGPASPGDNQWGTYNNGGFFNIANDEQSTSSSTDPTCICKVRGQIRLESEAIDGGNNFFPTFNYGNASASISAGTNQETTVAGWNEYTADEHAKYECPEDGSYTISLSANNFRFITSMRLLSNGGFAALSGFLDYDAQPGLGFIDIDLSIIPTLTAKLQVRKFDPVNNTYGEYSTGLVAEQTATIRFEAGHSPAPPFVVGDPIYQMAITPPNVASSDPSLEVTGIDHGHYSWNVVWPHSLELNSTVSLQAGDQLGFFLELVLDDVDFDHPDGAPAATDWQTFKTAAQSVTDVYTQVLLGVYSGNDTASSGSFDLSIQAPSTDITVQNSIPQASIKSLKSYQMGVVYGDKYGRESGILTNSNDQVALDITQSITANKLMCSISSEPPYWAEYYKLFVKEIAKEYYNLVLYKAYPNEDQGEIEEGTVYAWLAFNSMDVDKVQRDDYLVLKKKHGSNDRATGVDINGDDNGQAVLAKYRVIDIVNNAEVKEVGTSTLQFFVGGVQLDATEQDVNGKFFVKVYADRFFDNNIGIGAAATSNNSIVNGAVFEVEKSSVIDLDLFYECSSAYPLKLTKSNIRNYIKYGSTVQIVNAAGGTPEGDFNAAEWKVKKNMGSILGAKTFGNITNWSSSSDTDVALVTLQSTQFSTIGGSTSGATLPIAGSKVRFINVDGSFVEAEIATNPDLTGATLRLKPYTHKHLGGLGEITVCPSWFNCFTFGNGVESDRIRDDFNSDPMWLYTASGKQSGFKANLPIVDKEREVFPNDIIFSQIYNESSKTARYNEFILGNKITKKLNSEYGSIQKLYTRQSDVLAFCENKVLQILANKDALFNADGSEQLLSSTNVLGYAKPFAGDYGISKNPESFAVEEYRIYFTDQYRGAVCRLSMDGITNISDAGMKDWFNDNLESARAIVGSYDGKKDEYNMTIHSSTNPGYKKNVYTISYSEAVKGFTSFKSFIKESGLSLRNEYYTFKGGEMWLHNPDLTSVDRCNFYSNQYTSTISPMFNTESGTVKLFKTVAYEGTQSKEL